jgi:hypothetical protein
MVFGFNIMNKLKLTKFDRDLDRTVTEIKELARKTINDRRANLTKTYDNNAERKDLLRYY